jgi:formylglycine-generating enzyme required for sulfatase activity
MTSSKTFTPRWAQIGIVLGLVAARPTPVVAKPDPFVGTWILDVAKSTFSPGPAPKNQTAVYAAVAGGYRVTATGIDGEGKPITTDYTAKFDGKDYPVTGNADYDAVTLKRVNAHTIEFSRKKAGKVVQTGTIVVSADGKTRTVTADGTNTGGIKVHNVSVYDRK